MSKLNTHLLDEIEVSMKQRAERNRREFVFTLLATAVTLCALVVGISCYEKSHVMITPSPVAPPVTTSQYFEYKHNRQLIVREQCKLHPWDRLHIDGLIVDCGAITSWENMIELEDRDAKDK